MNVWVSGLPSLGSPEPAKAHVGLHIEVHEMPQSQSNAVDGRVSPPRSIAVRRRPGAACLVLAWVLTAGAPVVAQSTEHIRAVFVCNVATRADWTVDGVAPGAVRSARVHWRSLLTVARVIGDPDARE